MPVGCAQYDERATNQMGRYTGDQSPTVLLTMKTVNQHIRDHLLTGIVSDPNPKLQQVAENRVAVLFGKAFEFMLQEAKDRIRMGTFRYEDTVPAPWPVMARLGLVDSYTTKAEQKLQLYRKAKNREYLVDTLNYVVMEFVEPCEEGTFYESTEREEVVRR